MNTRHLHPLPPHELFARPHQHGALTRRQFLRAGAAEALVIGSGIERPWSALAAPKTADPRPIPHGTQFLAPTITTLYHAEAPGYPSPGGAPDPATHDPATITDFNGFVGLAYVGGQGTHHDQSSGETASLYWEVDLRFMVGEYVGHDGRHHHGTFGFV